MTNSQNKTPKIIVVGSYNTDLIYSLPRLPQPGETLPAQSLLISAGGKGSNQAIAAAKLGAAASFIGRIGKDTFAQFAHQTWREAALNADFVTQDPQHLTGTASIAVDAQGENCIIAALGANLQLEPRHIDAARKHIAQADALIVQLEIKIGTAHHALQTAKELGLITLLNPAPATALSEQTLRLADYITPNQHELQHLTSHSTATDPTAAARTLLTRSDQNIVVTLGAQGAQLVSANQSLHIPSFAVDVVDTTGAGDAFNAALAVALAEGKAQAEALRFANAAAALAVTKPGAARSAPARAAVNALLSR